MSKHKYSTIALIFLASILLIAGAAAVLTSEDIDDVCSNENSFLYRFNDTYGWGCGVIDGNDFNITINSTEITLVEIEPQGVNGSIQYNDEGRLNGSTNLHWDKLNERLGIGTNAPAAELNIVKTASNPSIRMSGVSGTGFVQGADGAGGFLGTYTNSDMRLLLQNGVKVPVFMESSNPYVGIYTSTPKNALDIEGAAVIGATYSGTNTAPTNGLLVEGNVGIGKTSATHEIEVEAQNARMVLESTLNSGYHNSILETKASTNTRASGLLVTNAVSNAKWFFGVPYNAYGMFFGYSASATENDVYQSGAAKMFIKSTGEIGMGTITPQYKLDVYGTAATDAINAHVGLNFDTVTEPINTAATDITGAGLGIGQYYYRTTYTTTLGETRPNPSYISMVTVAGNQSGNLTLPVSTDPKVTGRKIYRTKVGEGGHKAHYLATIANNVDTYYIDTTADATLSSTDDVHYRADTTNNQITIDDNKAMFIDTAYTSLGTLACNSVTTGGRGVCIGYLAGYTQTTAVGNIAIGEQASRLRTTGGLSTAIGYGSTYYTTTGNSNDCIGYDSCFYDNVDETVSIGAYSTFGKDVGITTTTGNTALGYYSGRNKDGNYNTWLGWQSGLSQEGSYNIMLGHNMQGSAGDSYILEIGTGNTPLISGDMSSSTIDLEGDTTTSGDHQIEQDLDVTGNFTGNQIYGEMHFHNDSATGVTTTIAVQDTWYNVTGFNSTLAETGQMLNGFTYNSTHEFLTPQIAGTYDCSWDMSFGNSGNNQEYRISLGINNTHIASLESHRKVGASGDVGDASDRGFINIGTSDQITLMVYNDDGTADLYIHAAGMSCTRIGS